VALTWKCKPQEKRTFILWSKNRPFDQEKAQEYFIATIKTKLNASILLF
jgi:hypothetical protein